MTYIVKSSQNSNQLMVELLVQCNECKWTNGVNISFLCYDLCMHFQIFFNHRVVIFITKIYMVLMMSPCALVCGVVMSIRRVVFLICDRFAYTYYYVD